MSPEARIPKRLAYRGAAWVHLSAQVQAGELVFTVANSYAVVARPTPAQPGGLGLATLRERLALLYPGVTPLALRPTADAFAATLRLPLRPAILSGSSFGNQEFDSF